jgi:hypothetical protein
LLCLARGKILLVERELYSTSDAPGAGNPRFRLSLGRPYKEPASGGHARVRQIDGKTTGGVFASATISHWLQVLALPLLQRICRHSNSAFPLFECAYVS